jgi:isopropylmalate/homocitrate/citramalate synthase
LSSIKIKQGDGLQNESNLLPVETKIYLIKKLVEAGCSHIETASFVSPMKIPAMANSIDVSKQLRNWRASDADGSCNSVIFSALTPNLRGFEDAMRVGPGAVDEVAVFASASELFSQKNIGCSIDESFERFREVIDNAKDIGIPVRGYVSCVLGCPYSGKVEPKQVAVVALKLANLGCHEISLGDTIGVGTPIATRQMINAVKVVLDSKQLAVHYHDTYGQALANIFVSLEEDIRTIDASVAGLGGCPYARGSSGNVATEDVVYMLNGLGLGCGIDLEALASAGQYITNELGGENNSKCGRAIVARRDC